MQLRRRGAKYAMSRRSLARQNEGENGRQDDENGNAGNGDG